jgi:hypothetical protein
MDPAQAGRLGNLTQSAGHFEIIKYFSEALHASVCMRSKIPYIVWV